MGPTDRIHVLVVDDEPTICRALGLALRRHGFHVTTVEKGEAGLEVIRREHVDCLVADLRIPDLRGDILFELAAAIQPQLRSQTLFTTGDVSEKAAELISACRCPVLPKPFDLSELVSQIRGLTARFREETA
jgi:DNA-binding response OmpR family regulator